MSANHPLHLLVVDDSEDDTFLLIKELRRGGFALTYRRVDNPAAMRSALETERWDVITSDHAMPAFSAPAALALAQELCPEVPFIIVSGELNINLAVSLMKAGAHDYIQKRELPLLAPTLLRELAEVEVRRQRQEAEEQRRISEEKFYKAFHNSPDAINLTRLSDGVYLEVNEGFERLSGYTAAEVIGKSTLELNIWANPDDRERLGVGLRQNGSLDNEEALVQIRDGSFVPALLSARLITVNGETCVLAFTRDIRQQRNAEEEILRQNRELQAASQMIQQYAAELEARVAERTAQLSAINQELEAFSYTIAHDLRAPLRAIGGYSQILLEDHAAQLDGDGKVYLERIVVATQRMHHLIGDLLEFSHLTQVSLNIQTVDLSAMAYSITEDLRQRDPQRHVTWVIGENLHAQGDRGLLHTVMENLLGNAWKFTAHQPLAQVEFGSQEPADGEPDGRIYFVRDNGAGFNQEYAGRLFGVFQRLHSDSEFPGTGIGLASVKRILLRHGGRIWAQGEAGRGATFYFTLPSPGKPESKRNPDADGKEP